MSSKNNMYILRNRLAKLNPPLLRRCDFHQILTALAESQEGYYQFPKDYLLALQSLNVPSFVDVGPDAIDVPETSILNVFCSDYGPDCVN